MSSWIYAALLLGELLTVIKDKFAVKLETMLSVKKVITFVQKILTNEILSITLAFIGLVAISVTGLLGGVMVYGTSADPVAGIVLKILGIQF